MRLYIWDNVLKDYAPGIIFALAPNIKAAREAILQYDNSPSVADAIKARPSSIYENVPVARVVRGGA